jgi:ABC-type dipeptide/oligopeptide/nickel transport system ATPase component
MTEIKDWYKETKDSGFKKGKDFKNHEIEPASIIGLIGQSGSGKSTSLIDFIYRAPKFTEILLFSGSGNANTEPLYVLLKEKIPEVQTFDTVESIPDLESFTDKDVERCIIFDDFLQITPKQMKKLAQYATAGRKAGFTCIFLSQNYTSVPKVISRNFHYLWLFKIPDSRSVETIYKNHINGITKDQFKGLYQVITKEPRNFLLIDLRKNELRRNFLQRIKTD